MDSTPAPPYVFQNSGENTDCRNVPDIIRFSNSKLKLNFEYLNSIQSYTLTLTTTKTLRIMALPTRLGGLGLDNPQSESESEYSASCNVCLPITDLIIQQSGQLNPDTLEKQRQARSVVRQEKRQAAAEDTRLLLEELPDDTKRMINLAAEKGASNWLAVLPVDEHGFYLHKTAFRDAICLRFGWKPDRLPEKCVCGSSFTVEHALTCNRGGFSFLRHNEIRDLSAKLLTEVCPNVGIEPGLQPLSAGKP